MYRVWALKKPYHYVVGEILVPSPGYCLYQDCGGKSTKNFANKQKKKLSNIKSANFVRKRVLFLCNGRVTERKKALECMKQTRAATAPAGGQASSV